MSTSQGAQALATTIQGYWRDRGYDVAVDVVPLTVPGARHFVVRSDLQNGWPLREAPALKRHALDPVRLATAALLESIVFRS